MRPKKFGIKPSSTSIERFKRTTRITPAISNVARFFEGTPQRRVEQVALSVLLRIPFDESIKGIEKKRVFRRNADTALFKKKAIGCIHCAERCNLAIALLNASGVKAWLARVLVIPEKKVMIKTNWQFHDFVEFEQEGRVKLLVFDNTSSAARYNYAIFSGTVDSAFKRIPSIVFRGADSKQIGGVGNWHEYEKYSKRLDDPKVLFVEINKNKNRVDLLLDEGIIPTSVKGYI